MNLCDLPDDIIIKLLYMISSSSYICLINTSKRFRIKMRTFKKYEIGNNSIYEFNINLWEYLFELGIDFTTASIVAAKIGSIHALKWLKSKNMTIEYETIDVAIYKNNLEIVKYLMLYYNNINNEKIWKILYENFIYMSEDMRNFLVAALINEL